MSTFRLFAIAFGLIVSLSFNAWSAAGVGGNGSHHNNTPPPKDDKDPKWPGESYDDAKKSEKPVLLIVRDEKEKIHRTNKKIQDLLDDSGVKAEVSKFSKVEVTESDTHGWKDALGGAFPTTGDERLLVIAFKNHQPTVIQMFGQDQAGMHPDALLAAMQTAEKVQEANKVAEKPADKK